MPKGDKTVAHKLYHIAQVNIGRVIAPIDDPIMAGFVARLDELNALADHSPGFRWRLQTEEGNATYFRPYDDDRILVNLSVWDSIEQLKEYVYKTAHNEVMRQRREWFEKFDGMFMALWWVRAGHIPTIAEAKQRLDYLREHGATCHAFTFRQTFEPDDCKDEDFKPAALRPCPAI
jgi:uncharacterized protein DUF3291